jgi:hypothetical protein
MKNLILHIALFAPVLCMAQDSVKIGRSQLTLPESSKWSVEQIEMPGITYTGDVTGVIPLDAKRMSFRNDLGSTKAVITTSMTKSAVNAQMSHPNHCANIKANDNVFTLDKGSPVRVDCLIVIKTPNVAAFTQRIDAKKALFGNSQPNTASAYYVQFDVGLTNGAKTGSFVLLAGDFQGINGDAISNNSKIPDEVIRWAMAFGKANSSGLTSFSGDWTFPALSFK